MTVNWPLGIHRLSVFASPQSNPGSLVYLALQCRQFSLFLPLLHSAREERSVKNSLSDENPNTQITFLLSVSLPSDCCSMEHLHFSSMRKGADLFF